MTGEGRARRDNTGKPRFSLLPPDGLLELAKLYTKGAEQYADRDWERGAPWMETFDSLQRHAWAWATGEDRDPGTGRHHMACVVWNAMALLVYALRRIGTDDRPRFPQHQEPGAP
jgi:hypothetical protein